MRAKLLSLVRGHKERVVYLSDTASKYLQEYLEDRYAQPDEPLFTHQVNHQRMTPRGAQVLLKEVGDKAGVLKCPPS